MLPSGIANVSLKEHLAPSTLHFMVLENFTNSFLHLINACNRESGLQKNSSKFTCIGNMPLKRNLL